MTDSINNSSTQLKEMEGGRYFRGALRHAILQRDGHKCVLCGKTPADGILLEVDHIIEYEDGGKTTLENGQTLCSDCNKGKSAFKKISSSDEYVSQQEFSRRVNVHRNTIADAIDQGIIEKDIVTGNINFTTEVVKWFNNKEVKANQKAKTKKLDDLLGEDYKQGYLFEDGQNFLAPRKATKAEMEFRIKAIRLLMIAGVSRPEILSYCESKFWISPKTTYKYFDIINTELKEESTKDKEHNYGLAVARFEKALLDCVHGSDMTNRVRILSELSKLQGLITHKIKGDEEDGALRIEFVNRSKDEINKGETE